MSDPEAKTNGEAEVKPFGQQLAEARAERGFSQRMLILRIQSRFPLRPLGLRALQNIEAGETEHLSQRTRAQLRSFFPSLIQ